MADVSTGMTQTSKVESPGMKRTTILAFAQQQAGLLVTNELSKAIDECRKKVRQISRECRMKNRKFRDIEFDLENDKYRCLEGLFSNKGYNPSDVQRVTEIFETPRFYALDGSMRAADIYQGAIGDCWVLSALATVSTCPELVAKFCVERDEKVGVYGFIFFKNSAWVNVIIDDLLFTSTPKYEELKQEEKELYHFNKEAYNKSARKGGKQLYFAKAGDDGETWVPLLEKAYAKLHGNYASISGGEDCEAIEDMTGGVSSFIPTKDILDANRFWEEELCRANKDRLFGCAFNPLSYERNLSNRETVQGLIGGHSYSVLRAVECKGKRFVVVRNPWGGAEWNGPWSDGSKEWSGEWLEILPTLGHVFGDDGQFVMEYNDFLNVWKDINRTILFDDSWVMSSQWLHIPMKPLPSPWTFGDLSFTFSLSNPSLTVIVLSQLDTRYFEIISGRSLWSLDFVLVKEGEEEPLAVSNHARFYTRSVNLEIELEAGNYIVYVRIDRFLQNRTDNIIHDYQLRQLSRVLAEKSKSQLIASNIKKGLAEQFTPTPVSDLIQKDYIKYHEKATKEKEEKERKEREREKAGIESAYASAAEESDVDSDAETVTTTTTTIVVTKKVKKRNRPLENSTNSSEYPKTSIKNERVQKSQSKKEDGVYEDPLPPIVNNPIPPIINVPITPIDYTPPPPPPNPLVTDAGIQTLPPSYNNTSNSDYFIQEDNNLYIGLKVYTRKEVSVKIEARLKAELDAKLSERERIEENVQVVSGGGVAGGLEINGVAY